MPKAVSESASEWVAFADLQSANNNDPDDEDAVVDDSPGLPDGDDDNISTMSVESSPAKEDDAPEQEDDAPAAASAHQHTAGHVPPHLPTATGEDNNAVNEPPPLPTAAEEPVYRVVFAFECKKRNKSATRQERVNPFLHQCAISALFVPWCISRPPSVRFA